MTASQQQCKLHTAHSQFTTTMTLTATSTLCVYYYCFPICQFPFNCAFLLITSMHNIKWAMHIIEIINIRKVSQANSNRVHNNGTIPSVYISFRCEGDSVAFFQHFSPAYSN